MSNKQTITKTTTITQIALVAALQCIVSPFSIVLPLSPVPVSFATLMLYLSVYILGKKKSVISCGIYLLIGLAGLPVFSGFQAGAGTLAGPTGGYLLGYFLLVYISGWFVEGWSLRPIGEGTVGEVSGGMSAGKMSNRLTVGEVLGGIKKQSEMHRKNGRRMRSYIVHGLGMAIGTVACYLVGTIWLVYQSDMNFMAALSVGVLPFFITDMIKIIVAVAIGTTVRKRLVKAGVV